MIEPTGERVIEEAYKSSRGGYLIYLMHVASYRLAEDYCRNKVVLELGCGTGYGASRIAEVAQTVLAVNVAPDAIQYANKHYSKPNLRFQCISAE